MTVIRTWPVRRLHLVQLFPGDHPVKIDGDLLASHVKSHVVIAEAPVDAAGDDVLPGMALHIVKPPVPVDGSLHRLSHGQGPVCVVNHFLSLLVNLLHPGLSQGSRVIGLSAAFREKCGLIQSDLPQSLFPLPAAGHRRRKRLYVGRIVI